MKFIPCSKFILVLLLAISALSCKNKKTIRVIDSTASVKQQTKSINDEIPEFLNCLNLPELTTPFVGSFIKANNYDTLDTEVTGGEINFNCKIFIRGEYKKSLKLKGITGAWIYDEGDLNGDGTNEIGVMPGYYGSACRGYQIYTYKNHKWKMLYNISTHLGDREKGIDYVKREGDKVRILNADDNCCQCFGLDTTYENLKK